MSHESGEIIIDGLKTAKQAMTTAVVGKVKVWHVNIALAIIAFIGGTLI